jgi:hypothetical protein
MFKKFAQTTLMVVALSTSATLASQTAVEQFERDWRNPAYTQIQLADVNVNRILSEHYTTSAPVHFTRTMLWDLERKKAWNPMTYIAHVVRDGKSWGRTELAGGNEHFTRYTQQRQWLSGEHALVIEDVNLFNKEQRVVFLGLPETKDQDGTVLRTQNSQPLFHVEHGVAGTEDEPLNTWRIVHLTPEKDDGLIKKFTTLRAPKSLPKYIEVYIEQDLGIKLTKK